MKAQVTIEISALTPFEIAPKTKALQALAKIDVEVLEKLIKLSNNSKAVEMFKSNFGFIENFLK